MYIKNLVPKIIRNSRGEKTIQLILETNRGKFSCSAPSGKSTGVHEVRAYNIRGLNWSYKMLKILCSRFERKDLQWKKFEDLKELEKIIKAFEAKFSELGGNITYLLEATILKAIAAENKKELWEFLLEGKKPRMPMPVGNCIEGGLHSHLSKKPDFQEFLLIPNEKTFSRAITKNIRAHEKARTLIRKYQKTRKIKKGDESGWQTNLTNEEVLKILFILAQQFDLRIGLDIAASTFCDKKGYYKYKNKQLIRDRKEQIDYIKKLIERYNIFYVEDPLQEEDFSGFRELRSSLSEENKEALIIGDDLTTTNLQRLERAIRNNSINAIIIKPNQIGSLVEVSRVIELCKKENIKTIFSHRSGETMDTTLCDLAIGFQADFVKIGIRGRERLIKLKRIVDIEKKIS